MGHGTGDRRGEGGIFDARDETGASGATSPEREDWRDGEGKSLTPARYTESLLRRARRYLEPTRCVGGLVPTTPAS